MTTHPPSPGPRRVHGVTSTEQHAPCWEHRAAAHRWVPCSSTLFGGHRAAAHCLEGTGQQHTVRRAPGSMHPVGCTVAFTAQHAQFSMQRAPLCEHRAAKPCTGSSHKAGRATVPMYITWSLFRVALPASTTHNLSGSRKLNSHCYSTDVSVSSDPHWELEANYNHSTSFTIICFITDFAINGLRTGR